MTDAEQEPWVSDGAIPVVPIGATGKTLPADLAAEVLGILQTEQPGLLSALIGRAYTGAVPAAQRRTRAPRGG